MQTINYKPNAKQLAQILLDNKVHFYEDLITLPAFPFEILEEPITRNVFEIPLARILDNSSERYLVSLQVLNDLIVQGMSVVVSEDHSLATITIE